MLCAELGPDKMRRQIRVLHIIEATTGGTRRHLKNLVTHLDPSRFDVSVICSTMRDSTFLYDIEDMRAKGVKVHVVQMVREINPLKDFLAFLKLIRIIQPELYDIVHTHSSKAGFLGRVVGQVKNVSIIVHTPHVFPFEMDVPKIFRTFYLALERFLAPFTDRFICVCNAGRAVALQAGLAPSLKFTVIENGIEPVETLSADFVSKSAELRHAINLNDDNVVIGTVGRLTRQKGHHVLLEAMRIIVSRFPHLRLVIVGDGELEAEIKLLIKDTGLSDYCHIISPVGTMLHYYSIFDIFVLPSLWEGLPYSLLDAMAMAKPIIASAVGGVPEVIENGKYGLLVPPKDKHALVDAISKLASNIELRCQLGKESAEVVRKKYRLDKMVNRTEKLYEVLVQEKTRYIEPLLE